jgi:transcriptional regulator with XRE-family HTH domain
VRIFSVDVVRELVDLVEGRRRAKSGEGRRLRLQAGLSVRELAEVLGVDGSTLDRWERGDTKPRGPAATRYQHVLDTLAELLKRAQPAGSLESHVRDDAVARRTNKPNEREE